MKDKTIIGVPGLPTTLGVTFIILKLCNVINWSWWWVLAPFWIPFVLLSIILIICLLMLCICYIISR